MSINEACLKDYGVNVRSHVKNGGRNEMNNKVLSLEEYNNIVSTTTKLLNYCRKNEWAGYDPYDALNSRVFGITPFSKSRICRIALTQVIKRLPFNLRSLLMISKEQNPKAIALFLMSFLKLSRLGLLDNKDLIELMIKRLVVLRSQNTEYWCWGYCFPWQTRTHLVPRGAPNLVCTVFAANALLDVFEENGDMRCLNMAKSAAEYILNELFWIDNSSNTGFSYPLPNLKTKVHNANFLGAALFCRIYRHTSDKKFLEPAMIVTSYSTSMQRDDGSWDYGEFSKQKWIDNFHTGYNLCALRTISTYSGTSEFDSHILKGYEFYKNQFFEHDGAPKYFHDRLYPIDIHSVAQSIITLMEFEDRDKSSDERALDVYRWAIDNMWNKRGYYYFQKLPHYTNRISYMRWSQAWMLLALVTLLERSRTKIDQIH